MDAPYARFAMLALVLVACLSLGYPTSASAKVGCEQRAGVERVELKGLPANPEAGRIYEVTADLPRSDAVNPRPLLFVLRCERRGPATATDSAEFRGGTARVGGYAFDVRFGRPGRWLVASMDVSGMFRDHGYYRVRSSGTRLPASAPPSPKGMTGPWAILIGAGGIAAAVGVLAARRLRLRRRGLKELVRKGAG